MRNGNGNIIPLVYYWFCGSKVKSMTFVIKPIITIVLQKKQLK